MKPLLAKLPPKRRTLLFAPVAIALAFLAFFLVGLVLNVYVVAMLVGPALGVAGAWALLGRPELRPPGSKPLVDPKWRPWMSVPTALVAAVVLYLLVGLVVTAIPAIPVAWLSYITLGVAVVGGVAIGLLAFGPPPVTKAPGQVWAKVPAERRPWLFFPLALVVAALVYYGLGVGLTSYTGTAVPAALIALPLALVSGCVLAYLAVGFPRPKRRVQAPPIPARARPVLFVATLVALGPLLALALGPFVSLLPLGAGNAALYVGLAVGYVLSGAVAWLAWGGPRRWSRHGAWKPAMPENARLALFAPAALVAGGLALVVANVAGLEFPIALLVGAGVGILAGLAAAGLLTRVHRAPGALRDLPEVVKPLVFFAVWFLVGALAYVALASFLFLHPTVGVVAGFALGLVVAAVVVEAPLVGDARRRRAEARRERRLLAEERARRLAAAAGRAPAPEAPKEAPKKGGLLKRFRKTG